MKVEPCFAAVDIKRLPNFTTGEMDLTSVLERLVRLENKMNNVEGNVSLYRTEQTYTTKKVDDVLNEDRNMVYYCRSKKSRQNMQMLSS